ncbi:penicillin-binding protein 1B [Pseudoalteromonas sp. G4]|uniref:penicillin-binding protein 1B n=1 Tax=Pseudoalteromonas sp. G4 TaxID=2992761 RepID=UPI00237DD8D1|nr:penicillin-binding protein 1B [Pseudoalteromonas sp. G4]MDE3271602.1 penicillin-binding protein 1B [Pseudoalteromonas sp. G4]
MTDKKKPAKATTAKTASKKKPRAKKQAPTRNQPSWIKRIAVFSFKLGIGLCLALALYLIYLDSKISHKFEGNKWQLPAQIYARAMTFYPGQYLSKDEVIWELQRLNYSEVNRINNTGQYVVKGNSIRIYRRAFEFYDGSEQQMGFDLIFGPKKLAAIKGEQGESLAMARLEPVQLARLANETKQDREFVPLSHIPKVVQETLLLVEDRNFYEHHGVSVWSIVRALVANIRAGRTVQGGSTLTQQLAKNFYLSRDRTLTRKINEALIALILDFRYSKDEILEAYLNEVYLGQSRSQGVHGFGLASEFYFGKPLNEIEYDQVALLVAMVKGPSYYNPRRFKERTMERRDLVLRLMVENGLISTKSYKLALARDIKIEPLSRFDINQHPGYMDLVRRELKDILDSKDTIDAGVRVFTYFDLQKQAAMEKSFETGLPYLERLKSTSKLEAAMLSVNVKYGGVSALVGARDSDFNGFNRALDTKRNIGSLVKPAIYMTAFESGKYTLGSLVDDEPMEISDEAGHTWSPSNFDQRFRGKMPLYQAFIGLDLGLPAVTESIKRLGVEQSINQYPSLLLGAQELSPIDVAQMYSTIAFDGDYRNITSVAAITNAVGELIYQHQSTPIRRFSPATSYMTKYAMQKVTREGTAKRLKLHFPTIQLAGKTGSTNNLRDSWFAGFDQNTVTVTWVGRDDNKPTKLTGSVGALELYIRYLRQLNPESIATPRPPSIKWAFVNTETGKQAPPGCGTVLKLPIPAELFNSRPRCN